MHHLLNFCRPDDQRTPDGILHLFNAGIHVLQEERVRRHCRRRGGHLAERVGNIINASASESHHHTWRGS